MNTLTLMTALAFILFMAAGITGPVNSLYVESLGASYVAIGLLGTVTSMTTIFFSYVWGHASDRLGRRKIFLALGLATLVMTYGLAAVVPSYQYLFPLRIVAAIARAAYSISSLALMGDLLERRPDERGRRMGTFRGLCSLGFGLMAFLSGSIADRLSIRIPFGLAAVFAAIAFVLALRVQEPLSAPTRGQKFTLCDGMAFSRSLLSSIWGEVKTTAGQFIAAVRRKANRRQLPRPGGASFSEGASLSEGTSTPRPGETERLPLAPLFVSAFLWSLVMGAVYAVWANYMVGEIGYSQATMSRLWALASSSEFPLMILAGWLSDRIGRLPMLSLGFLAWTLVFLGYVFVPIMPWIVLVQLMRGFAYSAFTATAMTYAAEVRKSQRGRVSGLYSSAGGIGAILGSSMGGTLTQFTSFRIMIGTNAALIFGGAVYLAIVAMRRMTIRRTARAKGGSDQSSQ